LGYSFLNLNFSIYPPQEKVNVEQAGDMGAYSDEGEPTVAQTSVEKEQSGVEKPPKVLTLSFFLNFSLISRN